MDKNLYINGYAIDIAWKICVKKIEIFFINSIDKYWKM